MGIISYRENCPYCGKILYYELAERQKRLGNSLASCPSCGKSYIDCCTYEWINLTDEEKKSVLVFGWNMTIVEETHVRKMYKRLYFTKFLLFGIPIVNKLKLQLDRLESFVYDEKMLIDYHIQQSIERTNNEDYLRLLVQSGRKIYGTKYNEFTV